MLGRIRPVHVIKTAYVSTGAIVTLLWWAIDVAGRR